MDSVIIFIFENPFNFLILILTTLMLEVVFHVMLNNALLQKLALTKGNAVELAMAVLSVVAAGLAASLVHPQVTLKLQ